MSVTEAEVAAAVFANAQHPDPGSEAVANLFGFEGTDPAQGLKMQTMVLDHWRRAGETLGGFKVGLTSHVARDSQGEGFRPFGFVLESRKFPSGSSVAAARVNHGHLEPEICCVIGKTLAGSEVSPEQAKDAVSAVCPAFEITETRLPRELPRPVLLANGLNNWGIVVGPERDPDFNLRTITAELFANGKSVDAGPATQDVIDDPYLSLAHAARLLSAQGLAFEPGMHVITGSVLKSCLVEPGEFRAHFTTLGDVSITFT